MPGIGDTNRLASLYDHITAAGLVYPTGAAGATVLTGVAVWTWSVAYNPVVPINTINSRYHIHSVTIETCNVGTDAVYELQLYRGVANVPVASIRFSVAGGFFGNQVYPVSAALIGPGEQVDARCMSSDGLAHPATLTISVCYCIED